MKFLFALFISISKYYIEKHVIIRDIHINDRLGYDERYVNFYTNITRESIQSIQSTKSKDREELLKIARNMDILEKIKKLEQIHATTPCYISEPAARILYEEIDYMNIRPANIKASLLSDW